MTYFKKQQENTRAKRKKNTTCKEIHPIHIIFQRNESIFYYNGALLVNCIVCASLYKIYNLVIFLLFLQKCKVYIKCTLISSRDKQNEKRTNKTLRAETKARKIKLFPTKRAIIS